MIITTSKPQHRTPTPIARVPWLIRTSVLSLGNSFDNIETNIYGYCKAFSYFIMKCALCVLIKIALNEVILMSTYNIHIIMV